MNSVNTYRRKASGKDAVLEEIKMMIWIDSDFYFDANFSLKLSRNAIVI